MNIQIDQERLAQITALEVGSHTNFRDGVCAMEAVAYIAGEKFSDTPECACPVISAFVRNWNDSLPDADRTLLILPLVPRLVGTKASAAVEQRRANMAADWLIRFHTPVWLRLAGMIAHADALENMPEITDFSECPDLMPVLKAAQIDSTAAGDAARAAARDAAWDFARAAAGAAARAAAGAAARDAAGAAARDAARAAARDAAWDFARAAAGAAARAAAGAAVEKLQASALTLIDRMIDGRAA